MTNWLGGFGPMVYNAGMTNKTILPGLIDPHVHFRDPGQTHKEDFLSGTTAALAGGFTTVIDMPNNAEPITTLERLEAKMAIAKKHVVCDVGFHFGTLGDNLDEFPKVFDMVSGLKIYLNVTTGNFMIDKQRLRAIYEAWPDGKPIMLHAEEDVSDLVLSTLRIAPKPTHICHVSSRKELLFVMQAKEEGLPITCGATPHHLFLTERDAERLGPFGHMKPYLKTQADVDFMWQHLDAIDVFESDHAPHTKAEKESGTPPFGVPGLETTLPLLLTAEQEGRLSHDQLVDRLYTNASRMFHIKEDPTNSVEVAWGDFVIENSQLHTKAGWSPFAGQRVAARVSRVTLHGITVFENGKLLVNPGSGRLI